MSTNNSNWPTNVSPTYLKNGMSISGTTPNLESSGLAIMTIGGIKYVYMASDNGKIARYPITGDDALGSWAIVRDYSNTKDGMKYDFESLAVANGKLMVGVEGSSSADAKILEMYPETGNISKTYILKTPTGVSSPSMEAMAFVPKNYCPAYWQGLMSKTAEGLYLAGFQSSTGKVYVYDITVVDNGKVPSITWFSTKCAYKPSDMCFLNGTLYALYDDNTMSLLQLIDLSNINGTGENANAKILGQSVPKDYSTQGKEGYTGNYEGITVDRVTADGVNWYLNLYLSTDPSGKLGSVLKFKNFNFSAIGGS